MVFSVYARPPTVFFHAFIDERKEYSVVMDQLHELHRNFDVGKYSVIVVSNDEMTINHAALFGFNYIHHTTGNFNEIHTLQYMHKYCTQYKNESFPVLYIHNKGGKYPSIYSYFTRTISMEGLVKHADLCLSVLDEKRNTVCGVRFSPIPYPHFNGNMWWTTSTYITELPLPNEVDINYSSLSESGNLYGLNRYYSERWILNFYYNTLYDILPEKYKILYNPIYYIPIDEIEFKISKSPVFSLPILAEEYYNYVDSFYAYKLDTMIQAKMHYSYNIQLYLSQPVQWCKNLLEKEDMFKNTVNFTDYSSLRRIDMESHFDYCRIRSNFSDFIDAKYVDIIKKPVFNNINNYTNITIIVYISEVHNTTQVEIQLNMLLDRVKEYNKRINKDKNNSSVKKDKKKENKSKKTKKEKKKEAEKINIFIKSSGSIPSSLLEKIKKIKLISDNIEILSTGAESIYESLYSVKSYCDIPTQNNASILFFPIMSSIEDSVFNNSMKLINDTIMNFSLCLDYLNNNNNISNSYDICGIQYNLIPFRQYLWNMVWMRCNYVRTLNIPMLYIINSNIFQQTGYSVNQYSYYRYFLSNPYHKAISLVSYPILQFGRYFPDIQYSILPHESPSLIEIQLDSYISAQNGFIAPGVYSLAESLIDLYILNNVTKVVPYLTNEMRNLTFNELVNRTRYTGSVVDYYRFMNSAL